MHAFHEKDENQRQCLQRFEYVLERIPHLKQIWINEMINTHAFPTPLRMVNL